MCEGNLVEAHAYCEEAVSMSKNAGMTANFLWSLSILGDIALREGKWDQSRAIFVEVLRRYRSLERTSAMIYPVEALASVAAHQNQPDRAVRLFAFGTTLRRAKNHPRDPLNQAILDRDLSFTKAQIDNSTFEALWAEGQALTLEQAVELAESQPENDNLTARAEREITPDRPPSRLEMDKQKYGGLTTREREVAVQIAQGKSNQAIAAELYVGLKTVEAHVTRVLSKLGFNSRAQIAGWAVAKGLAQAPQDLNTLGREG
jgi:DNA-binding CsgD family transcriptional regulator